MKKLVARVLIFLLVTACLIPAAGSMTAAVTVQAAAVSLNATKKTVIKGNTYKLYLRNSSLVSKTSWKTSNAAVATINAKGYVTAAAPGTATITCTAYLISGSKTVLTCQVTVKNRIPAAQVALNEKLDSEFSNAQVIPMGTKYDFTTKLTPSNSTDSTYYVIQDPEIAAVDIRGIVTPKKTGITVLEARIGLNKTEALKSTNQVVKKLYIVVTDSEEKPSATPTPTPTPAAAQAKAEEVVMVSSNEILIKFNTELLESSIVDKNGALISGVIAVTKAPKATDPGELTAKLSEDKKSVSLTASGEFDGTYIVAVFNKILTLKNEMVLPASFQVTLSDKTGPIYIGTEVDDSGTVCSINFNEAIDISGLSIGAISENIDTGLKYILSSPGSYRLSKDKKSLIIDLGGYPQVGAEVTFLGIKDLKGNYPKVPIINALVRNDVEPKPAAKLLSAERISKAVICATFDRTIESAGYAMIDGNYLYGSVDSNDKKKVNYAITNTSMTGVKVVAFTGFRNYNIRPAESNTNAVTPVDMTLDTTPPKVTSSELLSQTADGIITQSLILTYDKKVMPTSSSGNLQTAIAANNGNIYNRSIPYTITANDKIVTVTLTGQTFESGTYTFSLPSGFVIDTLDNRSKAVTLKVVKTAGSSAQLPAPVLVAQDLSNPSKIRVTFNNKLDMASVMEIKNYALNGVTYPTAASLVEQDETHAVIELTFASGVIKETAKYVLVIQGIKGYNDSFNTMKPYTTEILLTENNIPQIISAVLTSSNTVTITLSKSVTGTAKFQMLTSSGKADISAPFVSGDTIILSLPEAAKDSCILFISENTIKDGSNNIASLPAVLPVKK